MSISFQEAVQISREIREVLVSLPVSKESALSKATLYQRKWRKNNPERYRANNRRHSKDWRARVKAARNTIGG